MPASASGRNTGFVLPGLLPMPTRLIARVGFERCQGPVVAVPGRPRLCAQTRSPPKASRGIDPEDGWLYVSKSDNGDELLHYGKLLGQLGCEVECWPTERVRAFLRSERYFHAIHYPARIQHPSAQLCAGARRRSRARRRAHFRKHAGAVDRSRGRAQAHRHAARAAARRPGRAVPATCNSRGLMPRRRRDAHSDHHLCDHHRAAWDAAWRGGRAIAARSATPISPTITTALSAAIG